MSDKDLSVLTEFISYLEVTRDDEWQVGIVRNLDNTKNCVIGHLVNWFYGKDHEGCISPVLDAFEERWATIYMIYPVNDGNSPSWMNHRYDQSTPKARVIAYLENLQAGREKTTMDLTEEQEAS